MRDTMTAEQRLAPFGGKRKPLPRRRMAKVMKAVAIVGKVLAFYALALVGLAVLVSLAMRRVQP